MYVFVLSVGVIKPGEHQVLVETRLLRDAATVHVGVHDSPKLQDLVLV